jgi:hypothetical protein
VIVLDLQARRLRLQGHGHEHAAHIEALAIAIDEELVGPQEGLARCHPQPGLLLELADRGLFRTLPRIDPAAGQVAPQGFRDGRHLHQGDLAAAGQDAESRRPVRIGVARLGRAELRDAGHQSRL